MQNIWSLFAHHLISLRKHWTTFLTLHSHCHRSCFYLYNIFYSLVRFYQFILTIPPKYETKCYVSFNHCGCHFDFPSFSPKEEIINERQRYYITLNLTHIYKFCVTTKLHCIQIVWEIFSLTLFLYNVCIEQMNWFSLIWINDDRFVFFFCFLS